MLELENRMVIDAEWDEIEYRVKRDRGPYWDELPDECFEEE